MSPYSQCPAARPQKFFANDEESGLNPAGRQNSKHQFRNPRRRPIIESECHTFHVLEMFVKNPKAGGIVHRVFSTRFVFTRGFLVKCIRPPERIATSSHLINEFCGSQHFQGPQEQGLWSLCENPHLVYLAPASGGHVLIPKCPPEGGPYTSVKILRSHTETLIPEVLSNLDGQPFMRWLDYTFRASRSFSPLTERVCGTIVYATVRPGPGKCTGASALLQNQFNGSHPSRKLSCP